MAILCHVAPVKPAIKIVLLKFALSVLLSNSALLSGTSSFLAGKSFESAVTSGSDVSEALHGAKSEPLSSSLFRLTSDSSLKNIVKSIVIRYKYM